METEVKRLLLSIGSLLLHSKFLRLIIKMKRALLTLRTSKPISFLANTTHMLATKFHLIPATGSDVESGGYSQLPGGARAEAERRR